MKVSRNDFLADKKKEHRLSPEKDVGILRSYLCPENLIKEEEISDEWGLLYIDEKLNIREIKPPKEQKSCSHSEITIICSVMRRIGVKSQIFSYKKCKEDI